MIVHLISDNPGSETQPPQKMHSVNAEVTESWIRQANRQSDTPKDGELFESFLDQSKIGVPHRNKVEVKSYGRGSGSTVQIRFYVRPKRGRWKLKQSFEFDKNYFIDSDPRIEDFDNDGLKDLTVVSSVAARGANEVRTLLIYDKSRDGLTWIKNSEYYPNMVYNKKLDCIDAWLFHGATTTVFLRIVGDELKEIASVDTGLELIVTVVGKDGRSRILSQRKMKEEDVYTRYISFNPPQPYR